MKFVFILLVILSSQSIFANSYGTYSVPVSPELEPFATFDLLDAEVVVTATHVKLSYSLPAELVGVGHERIVLNGKRRPDGTLKLKGPLGTARCHSAGSDAECVVEYEDMVIDLAGAETAINARTIDPLERMARLSVAKIFSSEPVGIVKLDLEI